LAGVRDPRLVPVLGAAPDGDAIWALSELDAGAPARVLRGAAGLTPALATAVAFEALAGLGALHRAGLAPGALDDGCVLVAPDGRVRLVDAALREGYPGRDVAAAGALLCTMLEVPEQPGDELSAAERAAPALVATARAMAAGRYAGAAA